MQEKGGCEKDGPEEKGFEGMQEAEGCEKDGGGGEDVGFERMQDKEAVRRMGQRREALRGCKRREAVSRMQEE